VWTSTQALNEQNVQNREQVRMVIVVSVSLERVLNRVVLALQTAKVV